ncbi:MAG TPA: S8 family peptidase, partial [Candidatus Kapabacteria bacterium]|nr:S8 family peptidase [Candidatus Kapabacteria bacterium]
AYAANMGVRIVNCSWGGRQRSDAENDVIQYAYSKNTLVIAASGNNYRIIDFFPASYDHVLGVTSISVEGLRDVYSNVSYTVDVGAPGQAILSTVPFAGYSFESGTSMSTPQVAGAAALVLAKNPDLKAGQIAEIIRASAKGNVDSTVIDYMGRGMIDINRAVTDDNLYSARIEKYEIYDSNDDNIVAAGEQGAIEITALNYLKTLPSLKAKIEFIEGGDHILTNTEEITFGLSNTLSTVKNLKADFRFLVKDSTPVSTEVVVKVSFFDETVGYGPDHDYFRFIINPDYRDLNTNNLVVTFDSRAGIGYSDPTEHTKGSGFLWKNAPPEVPSQGRSVLYQSGLMLAADEGRIVSVAPAQWADNSDQDFETISRIDPVVPPTHPKALQQLHTTYADTRPWDSLQVGVTIDQNSYAFGGVASDAVIVDYAIRKRPVDHPDVVHNNESTVALFMDWDIGPSGASNIMTYEAATNTSYTWRQESDMPVIAVRILSPLPQGSDFNFHAIQNNGSEGIIGTYDGFTIEEKWQSMTIGRDSAGIADVSQVFGIVDVPMLSSDSIKLTYVMGLGVDREAATRTIDDAERQWRQTSSVGRAPTALSVNVYPNPFADRISFVLPELGKPATVRLFDAMGRVVLDRTISQGAASIDGLELPAGAYTIELAQSGTVYRSQVIRMR